MNRRGFVRSLGAGMAASWIAAPLQSQTKNTLETTSPKIRIGIVGGNFGARFQWHLQPIASQPPIAICGKTVWNS